MVYRYKNLALANKHYRHYLRPVNPVTFTRSSVAYGYAGNSVPADTPVYEAIAGVRGVLVEEATTNLLTANQSTGTDTLGDTTSFTSYNGATLSSSTDQAKEGSKSLKIITPGITYPEGCANTSTIAVTGGNNYTLSGWVYAPVGATLRAFLMTGDGVHYSYTEITGTGAWQYFTTTFSVPTDHTTVSFHIRTQGTQAITFYVDQLQLEAKAYPTTWTLGGTTRAASTMTIPSSVLNLSEGTIELEVYVNTALQSTTLYIFDAENTGRTSGLFIAHVSTNKYRYGVNGGSNIDVTTTLSTGWHRIAATYNSANMTFYIDGVSVGTPVTNPTLFSPPTAINIGSSTVPGSQMDTNIRKFHISRRKLSDTEIASRAATVANGGSYTVTKDTTFYLDGRYDLRGYKIASGG
jgi:hypothetical protein